MAIKYAVFPNFLHYKEVQCPFISLLSQKAF